MNEAANMSVTTETSAAGTTGAVEATAGVKATEGYKADVTVPKSDVAATDAGEPNAAGIDTTGTIVIRLGYRGANFAGFAEQPSQRTVAGELRAALETALRRPVELECAGRTDAGVHAQAQYISLPATAEELSAPSRRLFASLVALTPDDISIAGLYQAPKSFSARFDALERHYRYRIALGKVRPVLSWDHVWWLQTVSSLNVERMNEATAALVGEHDFRSFAKASSIALLDEAGRSTSRHISHLSVSKVVEAGDELVVVDVSGNAFLHNMVRIITGSLVEVGRGHRDVEWLAQALAAKNRTAAGPTAPAGGLCFAAVDYPQGLLRVWE